ncbi:MAG: hypothetical protein ACLQEQ_02365 [Nitrososphaerales archaeon]
MKREPSILAHSLRVVALVIILVSLVTFSTVGYSVYTDVSSLTSTLGGGSPTSAITAKTVIRGTAATFYLNVTLTNTGLYPIILSLVCLPSAGSGIACTSPSIMVLPGEFQTLHFKMTVENYSQSAAGGLHVDGQVGVVLEPFASMNLTVDLGALVARGGA